MNKAQYLQQIKILSAQIIERTKAAAKIEMIFGSDDEIVAKYWEEVDVLKKQKQEAQAMSQLHPKTRGKLEKTKAGY